MLLYVVALRHKIFSDETASIFVTSDDAQAVYEVRQTEAFLPTCSRTSYRLLFLRRSTYKNLTVKPKPVQQDRQFARDRYLRLPVALLFKNLLSPMFQRTGA